MAVKGHTGCHGGGFERVIDLAVFFVADDFIERFGALDSGATNCFAGSGGVGFEVDLSKEGGGLEVLVPGPALEGMVVAFVAVEAGSEEEMCGVFDEFFRGAQHFVVGGGRIFFG